MVIPISDTRVNPSKGNGEDAARDGVPGMLDAGVNVDWRFVGDI